MTRFTLMRKQAETTRGYPLTCRLCGSKHPLRLCPVFRAKGPEERLREVLIHRYCSNCLAGTHRAAHCTNEGRCRQCQEQHHTLLHISSRADKPRFSRRPPRNTVAEDDDSDAISLEASEAGAETSAFRPGLEEGEIPEPEAETDAFRSANSPGMETYAFHPDGSRGLGLQRFRPDSEHERDHQEGLETGAFQPSKNKRGLKSRQQRYRPRRRQIKSGRVESSAFHRQAQSGFRSGMVTMGRSAVISLQSLTPVAPTAVVKIEAGGRLHHIRALIDPCAATSILAEDLAQEIRLNVTSINKQRGCFIKMRGKYGQTATVTTHAIIVRNYKKITPVANIDASIGAAYTNLRLADPRFHISSPVRVVLGADVFPKIFLGALPAGAMGPLLAQNTIFGWALSGAC
ncbi:uncharacterized protein LOC118745668 [Rhagoletis pomonella]|uniref:uncharacterized protein LOC118745668 n=1 Tax=Rhagoletis pomonella TaxID=28610 RepID=UPI001784AF1A|nr:uncharacterized protein LOC118745668 [Rhagoletis pomonella]